MKKFDIVIIGSGLGGLVCAAILSKEGFNVCVLEKHNQIGGCLQNFERRGCIFDTGVHYVGGLKPGGILYRYFDYLGLTGKLKYRQLNPCFDEIGFYDNTYSYATGFDNFTEKLVEKFPGERNSITRYVSEISELSKNFPLYNLKELKPETGESQVFTIKASQYIESLTTNKRLQNVLAGTNLLYAGVPDVTPMYIHALINYANIEGAFRFIDGSSQIAGLLAQNIEKNGGVVITGAEATKLEIQNGLVEHVELANGQIIEGKNFISAIHPSVTLGMIEEGKIRNAYRLRIDSLENTISSFIIYVVFKENSFPYLNKNVYYYNCDNVWTAANYSKEKWPQSFLAITPATSKSEKYADCMSIMTFMKYEEVQKWENTSLGNRGEDYREFKKQKAEILFQLVEKRFPGIKNHIKTFYTSSPLTYRDYTGTRFGAIYGIQKDANNMMKTLILPRTKIQNLFLAGQNTNIHGVLGVTIGSVITCGQFMDINYLVKKIRDNQ